MRYNKSEESTRETEESVFGFFFCYIIMKSYYKVAQGRR